MLDFEFDKENENEPAKKVHIARQPILTSDFNIFGYDLLYRATDSDVADIQSNDAATTTVCLNAITQISLSKLIGDSMGFIKLNNDNVDTAILMSPGDLVLDIQSDNYSDPELLENLKFLVNKQFKVCITLNALSELNPKLLPYVKFVKIDIRNRSLEELETFCQTIKPKKVKLIATMIENHELFQLSKQAGFDYFQGYFLFKPQNISSKQVKIDLRRSSQLLTELCKPDADIERVEQLISQDPILSFKLLRIINSAAYVKSNEIESLHQAIVYMGLPKLQAWISIILMNSSDCRSPEIIKTAMIRAKMTELLSTLQGEEETSRYFLAGMFSLIDAIFDEPIDALLKQIQLGDEMTSALVAHEGPIGKLLHQVIHYTEGNWDDCKYDPLLPNHYSTIYQYSIAWSEGIFKALS